MHKYFFSNCLTRGCILVLIAAGLGGCLPSTSDGPTRIFSISQETDAVRQSIGEPNLSDFTPEYRDGYVMARMYAIDLAYYEYEAALTHERQDVNFVADVVNIGLTSSVPLVAAKATKDVLGATASGLTGVKTSYNDDVLLNRTIPILQSQMRANRALVASRIFIGLKQQTSTYPLSVALSDLEDYYRAGTISGALLTVSSTVAIEASDAQDVRAAAIRSTVITNPTVPLVVPQRGRPVELPGDVRLSPAESTLRVPRIKDIQRLVCAPIDGKLGADGSITRTKIKNYLVKFKSKNPADPDTLTFDDRADLLDAVEANEKPQC